MKAVNIFELTLYDASVEDYCRLSKEEKIEWIKKHTAQTDDALIQEFVDKPLRLADGKACCGGYHSHGDDDEVPVNLNDVAINEDLPENTPTQTPKLKRGK